MTRILLIDDNENILHVAQNYLVTQGYEVHLAVSGNEGIETAYKYPPHIVVCDIMMPDMNGYKVFEILQQNPVTRSVPFIFMSALSENKHIRQGMILGADDYLTKPFGLNDLEKAIETRLRRHQGVADKFDTAMNALRESITYALPHELRTPLMGIMGYSDFLYDDADTITPDEIRSYATSLIKSGNRLHRLIENYLIYAQLEIIASEPEKINRLRRNICDTRKTITAHATAIARTHDRESDLKLNLISTAIAMSESDLGKLIDELTDNAFKFSTQGTTVQIISKKRGNVFGFIIRDEGRGMEKNQLDIIGAYVQFDRSFYEQPGMGLGLIICTRLIDLYGGKMKIDSALDAGTKTQIFLPVKP